MKKGPRRPTLVSDARRAIAREAAPDETGGSGPGSADATKQLAAPLQLTCSRVCDSLRDVLGVDGCSALLDRAIASTEREYPVLRLIRTQDENGVQLGNVAAGVDSHGIAEVDAAIGSLFATLSEVLSRLIGRDMALRLMDLDAAHVESDRKEDVSQ